MTLLKPVVSEKAYDGVKKRVYTFQVSDSASKPEIKRAVQEQFKVTVTDVRTLRRPNKIRQNARRRGQSGLRAGFKKALVQLKEGDSIKELEA